MPNIEINRLPAWARPFDRVDDVQEEAPVAVEPAPPQEAAPLAVREWQRWVEMNGRGPRPVEIQVGNEVRWWREDFAGWEVGNRLDQPFQPFEHARDKPMKLGTGKRGEELFHLILSGIREIYGVEAIIAGGAVRDFAAGLDSYKDVDVFLPLDVKAFQENVEELGWAGKFYQVKAGPYLKQKDDPLGATARGKSVLQNMAVDIIFLKDALSKELVDTFPVHAQRGIWTLEKGLTLSPEAQADIANKTFTLSDKITDKKEVETIKKKVQEWLKRPGYKGWKIIEPEIRAWWDKQEEIPF